MKTLRLLIAGLMVLALTADTRAEKKDEKKGEKPDTAKLLVGLWKVDTSARGAPLGIGDSVEFSKDGKNKTTRRIAGKQVVSQGTYQFEKDQLVLTAKSEAGISENVLTIKKITDAELVLSDNESGKVMEFLKVPPVAPVVPRVTSPLIYGGVPHFSPGRYYIGGYPPGR